MRVGIGMVSRGEVGLIVAGVGVSSGALTNDIYTAIIIMVARHYYNHAGMAKICIQESIAGTFSFSRIDTPDLLPLSMIFHYFIRYYCISTLVLVLLCKWNSRGSMYHLQHW